MFAVHMLMFQVVLILIPDLRQALGAEISTWDFVLSQGSGNAALCLLRLISAKRHADEGAAAVADHDGNRQSNNRQRKNDRVGRVAVGAEITCIGNKNLINDVAERSDEQRDNTRGSIQAHSLV